MLRTRADAPVGNRMNKTQKRRLIAVAIGLTVILGLAAAWRWSPLGEQVDTEHVAAWMAAIRQSWWAPLFIVLIYLGASLLMLPNTVLNAATILSFGSAKGMAYALGGSMVAALVFYALGRRFGTKGLRKLAPQQLEKLQKAMEHGSTLKVASLRMVPVAPFSVVNVVAGSIRVGALPFAAGSFLGLLPGNLMMSAFGHQLRAVLRNPSPRDFAVLAAIVVVAAAAAWWLQRRTMAA